jgi:hypothetical protein
MAIQLELLFNDRCEAHSRPGLLRTPPAALAEYPTITSRTSTIAYSTIPAIRISKKMPQSSYLN